MSDRYWNNKNPTRGRPREFKTPAALWKAAVEYFNWNEDNPMKEQKAFAYKGDITVVDVEKTRVMTLQRMCSFIGIHYSNYTRTYRKDDNFTDVCEEIDVIIRQQKFEGAASNIFNGNIIARDLGLIDKVDTTSNGETIKGSTTVVTADDVQSVLDMI